jgi:hypothetical protein
MPEPMTPKQLVEMVTSRPGYTSSVGTRVLFAEAGCVHLALDRRPDLLQASLVAKAKAIQIGNTVCVANVEVVTEVGGDERMCAFATVTLRVVDVPAGHQ